jgi:hypothetical protein
LSQKVKRERVAYDDGLKTCSCLLFSFKNEKKELHRQQPWG